MLFYHSREDVRRHEKGISGSVVDLHFGQTGVFRPVFQLFQVFLGGRKGSVDGGGVLSVPSLVRPVKMVRPYIAVRYLFRNGGSFIYGEISAVGNHRFLSFAGFLVVFSTIPNVPPEPMDVAPRMLKPGLLDGFPSYIVMFRLGSNPWSPRERLGTARLSR